MTGGTSLDSTGSLYSSFLIQLIFAGKLGVEPMLRGEQAARSGAPTAGNTALCALSDFSWGDAFLMRTAEGA